MRYSVWVCKKSRQYNQHLSLRINVYAKICRKKLEHYFELLIFYDIDRIDIMLYKSFDLEECYNSIDISSN